MSRRAISTALAYVCWTAMLLAQQTSQPATYVGCFRDGPQHDLAGATLDSSDMTQSRCQSFCREKGFLYAGTQHGGECFCANSFGKYGQIAESECNIPCLGNSQEKCGGTRANSIYRLAPAPAGTESVPSLGEYARQLREKNKNASNAPVVLTNDGMATRKSPLMAQVQIGGWSLQANGEVAQGFGYVGSCPVQLEFEWSVLATAPTTVTYTLAHSDGARERGGARTLNLADANQRGFIDDDWTLGANEAQFRNFSGWAELNIESPNTATQRIPFTLQCTASFMVPTVGRGAPSPKSGAGPHLQAVVRQGFLGAKEIGTWQLGRVAFSPDFRTFATAGIDQPIRLWEMETGREICEMGSAGVGGGDIVFSGNSEVLASMSGKGEASVWNVQTGALLRRMQTSTTWLPTLAISPDGRRLAVRDEYGNFQLFDLATGTEARRPPVEKKSMHSLAFSYDSRWLAVGQGEPRGGQAIQVTLWETSTGQLVRAFPAGDGGAPVAIAFSPDGRLMATGQHWEGKAAIKLWDVATGAEIRSLPAENWARVLTFSPDGKRLAGGSGSGATPLWDVATGDALLKGGELFRALGRGGRSTDALAFSPDGRRLATGYNDGSVQLWEASKAIAAAKVERATSARTARALEREKQERAVPIPRTSTGLQDCGTDFACFIKAFEAGKPVMMHRTRSAKPEDSPEGVNVTQKAYVQASDFTAKQVTYYTKLEDMRIEISEAARKELVQKLGKDFEPRINSFPDEARHMIGKDLVCRFSRDGLDVLLHNWSKDQFDDIDFIRADQCQGDYPPLGVGMLPGGPVTRSSRAEWLAQRGHLDEAEKELRLAITEGPEDDWPAAHEQLGDIDERQGKRDLALAEFRKAVELDPASFTGWQSLGLQYARMGQMDQAAECYRKQIDLDENLLLTSASQPCLYLCTLYGDDGPIEKNAAACEEGIKKFPNEPMMWNELGWIYATSKGPHFRDPSKALEYAQKAVALSEGKVPEILDTLAEAYYASGDYNKAVETETKALSLSPDSADIKRSLARFRSAASAAQPPAAPH